MTRSAPRDRTKSTFRVLHTPVTSAPSALAICTASVPTPPDAPLIRTVVPGPTWPTSRMAIMAVRPDMTDAAASLNESLAGFLMSRDAAATVNSANVPWGVLSHKDPNTASSGWRSVTFLPTASTTPATSVPRTGVRGPRSPSRSRRTKGTPVTVIQSGVLTLVARTRIRTSSSPTGGRSRSPSFSTRSGAPYLSWTIAFISISSGRTSFRRLPRRGAPGPCLRASASDLLGRGLDGFEAGAEKGDHWLECGGRVLRGGGGLGSAGGDIHGGGLGGGGEP